MALTHVATSDWVVSVNTLTPTLPTGTATGDYMVMFLVSKYDDATLTAQPTGWTDIGTASNTGRSAGNDNGNLKGRAWIKQYDGSEAMPLLSPTPNNVSAAKISTYRVDTASGKILSYAAEVVKDDTTGTPLLLQATASLGLTAGDILHWDLALNSDVATLGTSTVTVPSCTVGANTVNVADGTTSSGTDMRYRSNRNAITAGTSTGNASVSTALAGTTTNSVGVGLLIRLREANPPPPTQTPSLASSNVTMSSATVTASGLTADGTWSTIEFQRDTVTVQNTASATLNDSGLTASTAYTYRARAVNVTGGGPWSSDLVVNTIGSGQTLNAALLAAPSTTYSPGVAAGAVAVVAPLLAAPATVLLSTVVVGAAPPGVATLVQAPASVITPLVRTANTVVAPLVTDTAVVHEPPMMWIAVDVTVTVPHLYV